MLTAFDLQHLHVGLAADLARYATASALAEVMLRFAPADPHPESYDLFRDALARARARRRRARSRRSGFRAALASGERARVRALARRLRARRHPRCPPRARCRSAPGRAARSARPAPPQHGATQLPARRPGRSRGAARSRRAAARARRAPRRRPPAAARPLRALPSGGGRGAARRSSSGCAGPGWRRDRRDGGTHRPRQVRAGRRAHRPADGPARRGAAARDHDRPQLRAARAGRAARSRAWWTCRGTRTSSAPWSPARRASTWRCWSSRRTKGSCRRPWSTSRCWSTWACRPGFRWSPRPTWSTPTGSSWCCSKWRSGWPARSVPFEAAGRRLGADRSGLERAPGAARRARGAARAAASGRSLPAAGRPGLLARGRRHRGHRHRVVRPGRGRRRGRRSCRRAAAAGCARSRAMAGRSSRASRARGPRSGIAGLARDEAERGAVLVVAGGAPWPPTAALDVELALAAGRAAAARAPRAGSASIWAPRKSWRGCSRGRRSSRAGAAWRGWCSSAGRGTRRRPVRLRSYSPVTTIGGGRVLDPDPPRRRAAWPAGAGSDVTRRSDCRAARAPARRHGDRGSCRSCWVCRRPEAAVAAPARGADLDGWSVTAGCARRSSGARRPGARALKALSSGSPERARDAARDAAPRGFGRPSPLVDAGARGRGGRRPDPPERRAWPSQSRLRPQGRRRRCRDRPPGPDPGGGRAEPRRAWRSSSARPGARTSARFSDWRPRPGGSRPSSGSDTTPGRRWSGSRTHWPTSAATASSSRPRSGIGWESAASS